MHIILTPALLYQRILLVREWFIIVTRSKKYLCPKIESLLIIVHDGSVLMYHTSIDWSITSVQPTGLAGTIDIYFYTELKLLWGLPGFSTESAGPCLHQRRCRDRMRPFRDSHSGSPASMLSVLLGRDPGSLHSSAPTDCTVTLAPCQL